MPSHKEGDGVSIGEILGQNPEVAEKLHEIEDSPEAKQNALEVAKRQALEKIDGSKIEEARAAVEEIISSQDEDDNKIKTNPTFKELVSIIGGLSLTRQAISEATDIDSINALSEKEINSIDSLNTLYEKLGGEYSQKYEEAQKTETSPASPPDNLPILPSNENIETKINAKEFSEEEKSRILEEAVRVYNEALANKKSIREAENASNVKFIELVTGDTRVSAINKLKDELREEWARLRNEQKEQALEIKNEDEALKTRLKEAKEPEANPLTLEQIEKDAGINSEGEPKLSPVPVETGSEKEKLNQLVDEAFRIYQENSIVRDGFDPKRKTDNLTREAVGYLKTRATADGIMNVQEAVSELRKRIAESQGLREDEIRDNTPFDSANFPPSGKELMGEENRNANYYAESDIPKKVLDSTNKKEETVKSEDEIARAKAVLKETKDSLPDELSPKDKEDIERISNKVRSALGETEITSTPETEPTPAEAELISKVETIEDVEKLPEETKEKIGKGFSTMGFRLEAWKNEKWAGLFGYLSKQFQEGSGGDRFLKNLRTDFIKDREKAKAKEEAVTQGNKSTLSNVGYLTGNILRYGRGLMDITGVSVVNPLKWVTWGAMATARTFEAAKEVSLETTTQENLLDVDLAFAEAVKIYEKAGGTYGEENGKAVSKNELKTAYYRDIPKDLAERLSSRSTEEKLKFTQELSIKLITAGIERSVKKSAAEIEAIESSSLPPEEKEKKIQELVLKNEAKLRDYDRIIDSTGKMDVLAVVNKRIAQLARITSTAMTLETLAELPFAVERIWHHTAEAITATDHSAIQETLSPEQIEKQSVFIDSTLGVNSKDGISNEEALKIASITEQLKAAGKLNEADFLKNHYAPLLESASSDSSSAEIPTGLTKIEVEENIKTINDLKTSNPERAKELLEYYANAKVEGSDLSFKEAMEHPEKLQGLQDVKTGAVGEVLKPFRFENPIAGNQDSIWFSTEQSFRMNPDRFGYDATKDGSVSEWAKQKTAETLKELADKKFGGKIPDLVHDGDKVIIEMGTDGHPHVEFENSSGIPTGHLPEKPSGVGIEKAGDTTPEQAWKNAPEDSRDSIVRQFIAKELAKPEAQTESFKRLFPKLDQERINVYAKMFNGEWNKIDTPQKLAQSLFEFDNRVKEYTALILEGKFDKNVDPVSFQQLKANIFPIEAKSGKLFFTQFVDEGKWQLFEEDAQGVTHQLDRKKGFIGGKTQVFDTMHVRKFLRSH